MLNRLLNIGISDNLDFYQKRETKALNLFSVITITGAVAGTINNLLLGEILPAVTVFLELLASIAVIVLNYRKMFEAAAYVFMIALNITLYYMNVYYEDAAGNYIYYFPFFFCIALLHNPNKGRNRDAFFFGIALLSFLFSKIPFFHLFPKAELSEQQNLIVFRFNLYLGVILTAILVYLVIRLINRQYSELTTLLSQSEKDKLIIEASLKEKDVLLAEIQHRVKNNLSVLIGLFNLQKNNTQNEEARSAISEAKNRVLSIAMVHEKLYRKDNLSHINLKNYLSELTREIICSHPLANKIKIEEDLEEIKADITKAVPIGLIVNESLTNSLKHAFTNETKAPLIRICLTTHFGLICIKVSDNGIGFPEDPKKNEKSLGLTLIESLADQIDAEVHYSNNEGAMVKLSIPV